MLETRLRAFIPDTTGGTAGGAGGASTASTFITYSADGGLSAEKILTASNNITITTDATAIYISANTGVGGGVSGASTASLFITYGADAGLSNEKILTARSAILIETDASAVYLSATSSIPLSRIGNSTFFRLQEYANLAMSAGRVSGGLISTSATTYSVGTGTGLIKANDSDVDNLLFFDWAALATTATVLNTTRFIGVAYNGGSPLVVARTAQTWDYDTEFPLGTIVNDSGSVYVINNPWATSDAMTNVIERFDSTAFIARDNRTAGLTLSNTGTRNVAVSAGNLLSRLSEFVISAINTSVSGSFDTYFQNGSGGWTKQTGQTQWNNTQYDNGTGTLASISVLGYSSRWFYLMADGSLAMLYGQADFTSLATALNEAPPSSVPDRILYEGILIGRFIIQASAVTPSVTQSAFGTAFTAANVTSHSNLSGLTANDHPQYWMSSNSGDYFLVGSSQASLLPNSKIITATSSLFTSTDSTSFYFAISSPLVVRAALDTNPIQSWTNSAGVLLSQIDSSGFGFLKTATFLLAVGTAATTGANKTNELLVPRNGKIIKAFARAKTPPAGAALIFDINLNGTTIWTTTGNRLQIAAGASNGVQTSFDSFALVETDSLSIDIDQVGSSTAGQDITVELLMALRNQ